MSSFIKPAALAVGAIALVALSATPAFAQTTPPITDALILETKSVITAPSFAFPGSTVSFVTNSLSPDSAVVAVAVDASDETYELRDAVVTTNESGDTVVTVTLPDDLRTSNFTLLATDALGGEASFTLEVVDPQSVPTALPGTALEYLATTIALDESAAGDYAGYTAAFASANGGESIPMTGAVFATAADRAGVAFTWAVPEDLAPGHYTLVLTDADGLTEEVHFVVAEPVVGAGYTVDTEQFTPGEAFDITLTGFDVASFSGSVIAAEVDVDDLGEVTVIARGETVVETAEFSEPTVHEDGSFTVSWTTPVDLEEGTYALVLVDGTGVEVLMPFSLESEVMAGSETEAATPSPSPTDSPEPTDGPSLVTTGSSNAPLLVAGGASALALAAGGGLLLHRKLQAN